MDVRSQVGELERVIVRMGVRLLEEELPDEARVDGGLCKVGGEAILYVSPNAPPWRRARVLLDALRRLPHEEIWLPPEIRELLQREDFAESADRLIGLRDEDED